jgi:hypothetical protein
VSVRTHLESTDNLFDYFNRQVTDAHEQLDLGLSSDTRLYLAQLLSDNARADRPTLPEHTLAELHGRAASGPPSEKIRAYRELGDRSLYVLGTFKESLEHRIVDHGYYADMGAAAYWKVDGALKRWFADAFGPVFRELALCFAGCVDLLDLVRDRHDESHPDVLFRLYREWVQTGSPSARARLASHGVVVGNTDPA